MNQDFVKCDVRKKWVIFSIVDSVWEEGVLWNTIREREVIERRYYVKGLKAEPRVTKQFTRNERVRRLKTYDVKC